MKFKDRIEDFLKTVLAFFVVLFIGIVFLGIPTFVIVHFIAKFW